MEGSEKPRLPVIQVERETQTETWTQTTGLHRRLQSYLKQGQRLGRRVIERLI